MQSDAEGVAIVMFDNAGGTDFERALRELPFVDEVVTPDGDSDD